MDIKIVYSPYNFFSWAKQNNIIPEQSFLVCAQPLQQDASLLDDENHYFVINEELNESQQMAQILVSTGACWANAKGKLPEDAVQQILGQYTTSWVLQQLTSDSSKLDQTVMGLNNDLVHPIAMALQIIFELGFLGADVLCYLGSTNIPTPDFYCTGNNTSEQIASFLTYTHKTFGEERLPQIVEKLSQNWQKKKDYYSDKHGFLLVDYNFQELINVKV